MMHISPQNPIILNILRGALTKDILIREVAFDYDNCRYFVAKDENSDLIKFAFSCNCAKEILANGGQEMLEELYREHLIPSTEFAPDYDITLGIDCSKMPKTQKIKKTMDEAEANAVRAQNEEIRKQRDAMADQICQKFASFKKDFVGAPIRKAFKPLAAGQGNPAFCFEIPYRIDEKYWVISSKTEVTVSFSLNFDNQTDRALARIFLLEFSDSKRYVKNPPAIMYYDSKFPEAIQRVFPDAAKEKYTNGVISFTLFPGHLKDGMDQPIVFLTGFRQFLHYHFHAIKASLHSRMRKRVEAFQRVLVKAKRDQETGARKFKETIGGLQHGDIAEESKQEEVFTYKGGK